MRLLFFGTSAFAVPSLEALVERRHQILRCITQPDRPQGRGLRPPPSPVKMAATKLGLPVEEPADVRASLSAWQSDRPDLGVVIAYGRILPRDVLSLPRHGMVGVHPSRLPRYRGANPIAWPILEGQTATAVTVFRLNERMDAGDIAVQRDVPIAPNDTTDTLSHRLASLGASFLLETIVQIEQGSVRWTPQDDTQATVARKFSKADGRIDWTQPAVAIARLVRAADPWPGAHTTCRGEFLKVWKAVGGESKAAGEPGVIVDASAQGIVVETGSGRLTIHELQPAGGRRMQAGEFLAGHALRVGEILGQEP